LPNLTKIGAKTPKQAPANTGQKAILLNILGKFLKIYFAKKAMYVKPRH
jgi:hypothetical protein